MTEIKTNGPGQVMITDDVIAVIAGTATLEVEGVAGLAGHFTRDIAEAVARKHMAKGVHVSVDGEQVAVSVTITVRYGAKVQEVSVEVQKRIKSAVETMTGLTVAEVNVTVSATAGENKRGV